MRIITGSARGVSLMTLPGEATRPTAERTKEAVFSMIQFDIEGRKILDLFAGSGQLALEALSRGADSAVIVDYKTDSIKDIKVLASRYRKQMELYAEALSKSSGLNVRECILYSLKLKESISVFFG